MQISNLAKRRTVPAGKGEIASRAIARGGQPYPRSKTPRQLLEFSARHANAICQPEFGGHTRHPVLLPRAALRNGKARAERAGARTRLKDFLNLLPLPRVQYAVADVGVSLDMDTPEDYKQLKVST